MSNISPLTGQALLDSDLARVVTLANAIIALEAEIETREEELNRANAKLYELQTKLLPDEMSGFGLSTFSLKNGAKVTVAPFYVCSLSDKDEALKQEGLKWLRTNNFGSLIKHKVSVLLGNDAVKPLASLRGWLNKKQMPFTDGQTVPNPTLKALMKEQIEAGKPWPLETFKAFAGKKAIVTVPKSN